MWRAAKTSYLQYGNEMAALLRQCVKEPLRTKILEKNRIHLVEKKWANGVQQGGKKIHKDFKAFDSIKASAAAS
ncbi:unnamed protein product [Amoebophrya sp. A120]|nr:unnamed protein product [Amoebophrya sp. A120]|eukprot:GSA120T00004953001.1